MIAKKQVTTYNVRLYCDTCVPTVEMVENVPFIIWDNKTTTSLADDTFSFMYICPTCGLLSNTDVKYPYQEFVEI